MSSPDQILKAGLKAFLAGETVGDDSDCPVEAFLGQTEGPVQDSSHALTDVFPDLAGLPGFSKPSAGLEPRLHEIGESHLQELSDVMSPPELPPPLDEDGDGSASAGFASASAGEFDFGLDHVLLPSVVHSAPSKVPNLPLLKMPKMRRKQKPVPEEKRDAKYHAYRAKNTAAAKRNRDKKREEKKQRAERLAELLSTQEKIRARHAKLQAEFEALLDKYGPLPSATLLGG